MRGSARVFGSVVLATLVLAGGCARRPPRAAPPPPAPLEVPVVPPRVLAPVAVEPEEPQVADEPAATAPRRTTRPRPRPETSPRSEQAPAQHDPSKLEGPPEPPSSPSEPKPAEPKTVLQTPQTAGDADAERRVREVLGRARRELGQVNAGTLGSDARTQYETARRFIDQAEDALKARNYMFARYLADKADALARGLTGR
jgi:hypothetical protein